MAMLCDEGDMRSLIELDFFTAFNAFYFSTSDDYNNVTYQNSNVKVNDIGMNTFNLDDLELTIFFRDSGDNVSQLSRSC